MTLAFWSLVALVTVAPFIAGLFPVLGRAIRERWLHAALGLAAGLLLGVAFLRVLPRTFALGGSDVAATLGLGFVALYLIESVVSVHGHSAHEEGHGHTEGDHYAGLLAAPVAATAALVLHMLLDGLVLPVAFAAGSGIGISTGIAIAAHKVPAGFAVGTLLAGAGYRGRSGVAGVALLALGTPLGVALGLTLVDVSGLVPHLLAVAGATLVFVAVAEILPEIHHGPHKRRVGVGLLAGFLAIWALPLLLA